MSDEGPEGPVLFRYGSDDCVMTMVNRQGLCVSGGAPLALVDPSQWRTFPKGAHGTEVAQHATNKTRGILACLFFPNQLALRDIPRLGEPEGLVANVSHCLCSL